MFIKKDELSKMFEDNQQMILPQEINRNEGVTTIKIRFQELRDNWLKAARSYWCDG